MIASTSFHPANIRGKLARCILLRLRSRGVKTDGVTHVSFRESIKLKNLVREVINGRNVFIAYLGLIFLAKCTKTELMRDLKQHSHA